MAAGDDSQPRVEAALRCPYYRVQCQAVHVERSLRRRAEERLAAALAEIEELRRRRQGRTAPENSP